VQQKLKKIMINPNDVKLGNLISINGQTQKVKSITENTINNVSISNVEGITISSEKLEKLGFILDKTTNIWEKRYFEYSDSPEITLEKSLNDDFYSINDFCISVKYFHDLQNLVETFLCVDLFDKSYLQKGNNL
jgi:hypothetical protein